jgi:hypothetical protein
MDNNQFLKEIQYFDKNDYNFKLNGGKMKLKYVTSPI